MKPARARLALRPAALLTKQNGPLRERPVRASALETGQRFERKHALHTLCMDMTGIPKRLKFMAYRVE